MEVISKLGGLGRGIGIGILSVISIVAVVMFSEYCYETTEVFNGERVTDGPYKIKNPVTYEQNLYDSAVAAAIFAGISAVACIVAIVFALLLSGQKILITIISLIPIVCGVACIICEGCFYDFSLKESIRTYPDPDTIRNTTRGQNYIKDTLKEFYDQAIKNIKAEYADNDVAKKYIDEHLISWDTVEKSIGKGFDTKEGEVTTTSYFNYANLWGEKDDPVSPSFKLTDDNDDFYLTFYIKSESGLTSPKTPALVNAYTELGEMAVASLGFTASYSGSKQDEKRSCCWNVSRSEYECKTLKHQYDPDEDTTYLSMDSNPWTLDQFIMIDDHYISNTKKNEDPKQHYAADYLIEGFPIAYTLVEYKEDIKAKDLYYEEDTDHFKVSGKSYAKYKNDNANKPPIFDDRKKYWCAKEPKNWDDAFGDDGICEGPKTVYEFKDLEDHGTKILDKAFDFTNIYVYPSFVKRYFRSKAKEFIFQYSYKVSHFAFAAFLITIVGIIFMAASVVTGFLPGSD